MYILCVYRSLVGVIYTTLLVFNVTILITNPSPVFVSISSKICQSGQGQSIIYLNNLHLPFIILLYFWQGIFVTRHNYLKQPAINHVSLFKICQVFANFVLTKHYFNTVWLCYNCITVWTFLSVKSWKAQTLHFFV